MNTKIRALLWEELHVGGAIVAVTTAVGIVCQLSVKFGTAGYATPHRWHDLSDQVLMITLGAPLLAALVLVLSTANSGHLSGGFSRRILRLPVDTWSAVLVALMTRLAALLLMSAVLVSSCWILFHNGPGKGVILFLGWVFLLVQVLDWARGVTPLVIPAAIIAGLWAVVGVRGNAYAWYSAFVLQQRVTAGLLLVLVLSVAAAYCVSVVVVRWTRSGVQLLALDAWRAAGTSSVFGLTRRRPFRSPLAAQVWFESKSTPLSLPVTAFLIYICCIALKWAAAHYGSPGIGSTQREEVSSNGIVIFEVFPYLALLLASFAWLLQFARRDRYQQGRRASFSHRQPITASQKAYARLIVSGMNLAAALAIIALVFPLHTFLFGTRFGAMISEALACGEASLREVLGFFVGIPLLVGLLAWLIMNGTDTRRSFAGVIYFNLVFLVLGLAALREATSWAWLRQLTTPALWLLIVLPSLGLISGLFATFRRGLISRRSVLACVLLWVVFAAGFFPFASLHSQDGFYVFAAASMSLGALPLLPYIGAVVSMSRRAPMERLTWENPEQHVRARGQRNRFVRAACLMAGVIALAGLAWLRWPQEPAYKALWRAEGLPTNAEELRAWYPAVEEGRNLANLYLEAEKKREDLDAQWNSEYRAREALPPSDQLPSRDCVPVLGMVTVGKTAAIPQDVWDWIERYWDAVANKVCPDLHAAAHSGLTSSHYPTGLSSRRLGRSEHLEALIQLSDLLRIEVWNAIVERRPEDATFAIIDMLPMGSSLKDEPGVEAQSVRVRIYAGACVSLENAMNRLNLPEENLARIQKALEGAFPLRERALAVDRALIGEQATLVDWLESDGSTPQFAQEDKGERDAAVALAENAFMPLADFIGIERMERLAVIRELALFREGLRDFALQTYDPRFGVVDSFPQIDFTLWSLFIGLPTFRPVLYCSSMMRGMVEFDLAGTALAVERFRLSQGRLPEHLDELVPRWLDRLPRDLWNQGRPLSYRIKDDGGYVVYSFGQDQKDDHGQVEPDRDWISRDITFTVAPPEFRERPQVAPEPSLGP
jgi:hypothetical protein